jgi:hypothetical protein
VAKMRRPNEGPPRVKTEDELQTLRPDELEAEISTHRAFAARVGKDDPGRGCRRRRQKWRASDT